MQPGVDPVIEALVEWLRQRSDCMVEDGLDEAELSRAEAATDVAFPPLWRSVLARAHPVATTGVAYPDWRLRDDSAARLVAAPAAGVLFDVEHNGFWWPAWGERPGDTAAATRDASRRLEAVAHLVPIRGHWFTGGRDDAPVLSIVQTDVYEQAGTLAALALGREPRTRVAGTVPFWTDLLAWSQGSTRA